MSAKISQALVKRLMEFMRMPGYRPLKDHDLAGELGLMTHERNLLRTALRELRDAGRVERVKGNRWAPSLATPSSATVGTLSVSMQGHGMVRVAGQSGAAGEYFIPSRSIGGALHGDKVEVEVVQSLAARRRTHAGTEADLARLRPEGRIVRVIERRKNQLVGLLMKSPVYWYVIPDHPRISENVIVSGKDAPAGKKPSAGRKVVVQLQETRQGGMLHGIVIEDLGDPDAPGVDVLSILREHDIATEFSHHTEKEVRSHSGVLQKEDLTGRLDLRDEMILTIDPADARDHDDAVSLRKVPGGGWILGVHIADVSHFVRPGSAIDGDARRHANSVYMVDRFIPMLPPYLTGEVCSLKAGRDRLAYSVFITYDEQAHVVQVEMHASVIHPRLLLDYDRVQRLITAGDGAGIPEEYHTHLQEMHVLATKLRARRMRHGAIDLSMPEVTCKLDQEGRPVSITRRAAPEAYHLIEEFMLAANIAVAERLYAANVPAIYRIHEEPAEDQWAQMAMDLHQLGVSEFPRDRHDLQRIARAYHRQSLSYPVSVAMLRNFKRALYSAECLPHFGLAFLRYTHFTSPIRRYSDLIVHRILKSLDAGSGGCYRRDECEAFAEQCSLREREAEEAEDESLIIKRLQFYQQEMAKGAIGPWPALVTGATARGLLVEIVDTLQRGFIPSHVLPDPHLRLDRQTGYLTGHKGRRMARIGDEIPVELIRVDAARRSVELRWVTETTSSTRRDRPRHRASDKSASPSHPRARRQSRRRRDDPA